MIDAATMAGLARIAARERDVAHAYEPGFVPESDDVAAAPRAIRSADPLSVAAPAGAYFVTPGSAGAVRFTRDGTFGVIEGLLCGPDGRPVLGFALGSRGALAPLRIDAYDRALGRASGARIGADGTFSYLRTAIDPRTGERRSERIAVGKLGLARFPAGTQPLRLDATHVAAPAGVKAQVGAPADGAFAPLITGARDLGNVDIVAGLKKMREAYDTFEAMRAVQRARGSDEKTTMDLVK
jgi:flagellar basal body rod protein FlgG